MPPRASAKTPRLVKCPWCGRRTEIHKDRLRPHIVQKGVRCVGGGFSAATVDQIRKSKQG